MATLIENQGSVSLYKGENDSILVEINGKQLTLDQFYSFNHNEIWNPVAVDLFNDPGSDNDNNILLLWNNVDHFVREEELYGIRESNLRSIFYKAYQALSFSSENGRLLGVYDIYGNFVALAEADKVPIENFYYTEGLYDRLGEYYGDIYNSHKNLGDSSNLTDFQAYNYIASNSDLISSIGIDIEAAKSHYTNTGKSEGRSFDSFSATNYLAKYGDLSVVFGDDQTAALKHYIQYGFSEGRTDTLTESGSGSGSSSTLTNFEAYNYIASNNDLISAFGIDTEAAKSHYTNYGKAEGRSLDSFSASDYLEKYNDLKTAYGDDQTSALKHYIEYGFSEGRTDTITESGSGSGFSSGNSSILTDFEALNYIASHGDLINAFGTNITSAKSHYTNYGKSEGRILDKFDEWGYLASNNDLITTFGSNTTEAVKHYINLGKKQGRSSTLFDAQSYLNNYSDLRNAFGNDKELATKHFVEYGFNEGRLF